MAEKKCSKCGMDFTCCADKTGCWCENCSIAPATLQQLNQEYDNCLCEDCLKEYTENSGQ